MTHKRKAHNKKDLTGMKFNSLLVIKEIEPRYFPSGARTNYLCRCDCGLFTEVIGCSLTSGNTTSCGCFAKKLLKSRSTTHGESKTRPHRIWQAMLNRCRNKKQLNYINYGGRGITVCKRWFKYENFIQDMGYPQKHQSLDRINNEGNYVPNNCRWATRKEQSLNNRNNRLITLDGETKPLVLWARDLKINQSTLSERIEKWPLRDALTKERMR